MPYLFNIAYLIALVACSPWLLWSTLVRGKRRGGWCAKLFGSGPRREGNRPCAWFHAVSVGEVNLIQSIIERFEAAHPDWDVVITVTTVAGYELACRKYSPRMVVYAPFDFTWAVGATLDRIRPALLVLAELEIWPNLVAMAKARGAKVAVVNGRLSERSFVGYRRFAWLFRSTFARLDLVAAQDGAYGARFFAMGAPPLSVRMTGSVKFDGAKANRDNPQTARLAQLAEFNRDDVIFLAGSTQAPEESLALNAFRQLRSDFPQLRLILVPRHPERFSEVAKMLDATGIDYVRRSQLESIHTDTAARVLLIDTVGELGAWWGTAAIGFVGGSLENRRGGQNMIEPAAYGTSVCFGPNYWNFRDIAGRLLDGGAAKVVKSGSELTDFVRWCLQSPAEAQAMGQRAAEEVAKQQGAADRTVAELERILGLSGHGGSGRKVA